MNSFSVVALGSEVPCGFDDDVQGRGEAVGVVHFHEPDVVAGPFRVAAASFDGDDVPSYLQGMD